MHTVRNSVAPTAMGRDDCIAVVCSNMKYYVGHVQAGNVHYAINPDSCYSTFADAIAAAYTMDPFTESGVRVHWS